MRDRFCSSIEDLLTYLHIYVILIELHAHISRTYNCGDIAVETAECLSTKNGHNFCTLFEFHSINCPLLFNYIVTSFQVRAVVQRTIC